ncbi:Hint domain-containing protein [Archangium sp.]|uniref:Hint domain-containing protein n=1 Tax=Archangium sp. TaxID=1872627 RepID=UPI00286D5584|nr:Hint domain-containing protein [Archangium sp.]
MNVSSTASPRKVARLVAALAALSMFGAAGCGQQKAPSQVIVDKQILEADSLHMARLYAQWDQEVGAQAGNSGKKGRGEMPIDLGDDTQYRFLKNRLLASGSTPDNSPQLFQRIEKLRKEKKAAIPGKVSRKDMITSTTAAGAERENPWCGHLLPLSDVESSDTTQARFQTFGLVTCFNGSDYAFADVKAFAANATRTQFRTLGAESLEDYAGAVLETPKLNLDLKANPDELLVVDSVAMAFNETTGETHLSYAVSESSVVSLGNQGGGDPDINTLYSQHPRELIGSHYQDNPIRTCLERGGITGYLDCDYTTGNYDAHTGVFKPFAKPFTGVAAVDAEASKPPAGAWTAKRGDYWAPAGAYDATRLYVPMRGEYRVSLPNNCIMDSVESDASIILLQSGGRCAAGVKPGTAVLSGSLPFKDSYRDSYYRTHMRVPYDGLADFGKDCLDHMQNVSLYMRTTLKGSCFVIGFDGSRKPYVRSRFHSIQNMDFRNACLAEGTKVTTAEGKAVTVEQVKVGDKLLANGNGLALTVTTVSRGGERKPMVKLLDEQGGEVMVTETHPLVTARRGVVQAGELKAGDALLTRTGATKLVGVERVSYSGDVFNFALGTPEELAKAGPQARTLYANGFLVGDSHLQSELEKARKLDVREVLSKLNGAWHEDFRREQARKKTAQR